MVNRFLLEQLCQADERMKQWARAMLGTDVGLYGWTDVQLKTLALALSATQECISDLLSESEPDRLAKAAELTAVLREYRRTRDPQPPS